MSSAANPVQHFVSELRRRRVFRAAAIYVVGGWVAVQAAQTLVPLLLLPDWIPRAVVLLALLGFPVAVGLAWALDVTPEGIRRTDAEATPSPAASAPAAATSPRRDSGRALGYLGVGVLVALAGFAAYARFGPHASEATATPVSAAAPSLAVLPFENMSANKDNEYFSDGVTEDLLTSLSKIPGLRVISRTSVMQYKGTTKTLKEIGRELGVAYVLEGSVQRDGDEVRITAQLIDARSDQHVWAERYDRELKQIFQVQSEIADRISGSLKATLTPEQKQRIAAGGTGSTAAYDLYLRGRDYLNRPGGGDIRKYGPAAELFRQALRADPKYANAYAGLAEIFHDNVSLPPEIRRDSTRAYAGKALALDPRNVRAHIVMTGLYLTARRFAEAEKEVHQALEIDPNDATATLQLSLALAWTGRVDQALRWAHAAERLDPVYDEPPIRIAQLYLGMGDVRDALASARRAVELAPDYPAANSLLSIIYHYMGDTASERTQIQRLLQVAPDHPGTPGMVAYWALRAGRWSEAVDWAGRVRGSEGGIPQTNEAVALIHLGKPAEAGALLVDADRRLRRMDAAGFPSPFQDARVAALRGDRDRAIALLRRLHDEGWRSWMWPDVYLNSLEGDPRYEALRAEMRADLTQQLRHAQEMGW